MFRPYMLAIFTLRSNFSGAAIQDVWVFFWWVLGVGWGGWAGRDLVIPIAGTMTWAITSGLSLVFCVHSINLVFNNRDEVCLLRGTN